MSAEAMRRIGDRRAHVRLEVVGVLWGTLEFMKRARVINVNDTGALIASSVPIPPDSVQTIHMTLEGHNIAVDARVCHLRSGYSSDELPEYHIGIEFLSIPAALH